jgi:RNA polymerase sigma factor for flagellar operon FliA
MAKKTQKNPPTEENEADIWKEVKKGSAEAREKIILKYLHLVKYVINRIVSGHTLSGEFLSYDDLYSCGVIGLMEAVDGFDPGREVKFTTYAVPRVRGSIIDELRALDWIPRSLRARVNQLQKAYAELENEYLRPATDEEICAKMEMTPEELDTLLLNASRIAVLSLDEEVRIAGETEVTREDMTEGESVDPRDEIQFDEVTQIMKASINNLPEKERLVLLLYYVNELTFKEIGEVLEVTESRVCQLHSKAVARLRGRLRQYRQDLVVA